MQKKVNAPYKAYLSAISRDYFRYLARNYPVMCLSDEFYFFPRVMEAIDFLNCLETLNRDKITHDITYIKGLRDALQRLDHSHMDMEDRIDSILLNESMSTFLREFGEVKIWKMDPGLYLKISLLGIDQILVRFSFIKNDIYGYLRDRIGQIPYLLDEAKKNLKAISRAHQEVSLEMVTASIKYFKEMKLPGELERLVKKVLESLEDFRRFLVNNPLFDSFIEDREVLRDILRNSFCYDRDLEEIFEIASEEYKKILDRLVQLAKSLSSGREWQQLLSDYRIDFSTPEELMELYTGQIGRIKRFIQRKKIVTIPETQEICVRFTPCFMRPVRASASYSSPVTNNKKEPAYFYITPGTPEDNLHAEYIFVTAHETYPGHHLVDSIRRGMDNPIRQKVESPLFYEGWASYAEGLIDELGYIKSPLHKMLGLRRQAWRAVRAMLDVGTRIGKLTLSEGEDLLRGLGYSPSIARSMSRHYMLLPGYQLCYTVGKFEIDRLRKKFSSRLGLREFHDFLLKGGELPFYVIERRMEYYLCRRDF